MIYRKLQAGIICTFVSSIGMSVGFPFFLNELTYISAIAVNLVLYIFFITLGLIVIGIPLSYIIEKLFQWIGLKSTLLINLYTLILYLMVPTLLFNIFSNPETEVVGILTITYIVSTCYFIVDALIKHYYSSYQSYLKKLTLYVSVSTTGLFLISLIWSMLI